jgi:hypothetical protein
MAHLVGAYTRKLYHRLLVDQTLRSQISVESASRIRFQNPLERLDRTSTPFIEGVGEIAASERFGRPRILLNYQNIERNETTGLTALRPR